MLFHIRARRVGRTGLAKRLAVVVAMQLAWLATALAQSCSVGSASGNYGTPDVLGGGSVDTSSQFTVTCSGCFFGCSVNVCVQFNQGSPNASSSVRYAGSGSNTVKHELYTDSGRSQVWGSWGYGTTAYGSGGVSLNLSLPIFNGSSQQTFTVYGRFLANQQSTIPGTYTWTTTSPALAYGSYSFSSPNCGSNPGSSASGGTSTWQALVNPNCVITTNPLYFPNASLLTSNIDGAGSVVIQCTNTTPYSIGIDNGQNVSGTQRRLKVGTNYISYNLYTDQNRTSLWSSTTSSTSCSSGTSTCVLGTGTAANQTISVYGRVPAQASPPAGTYVDTVLVTVTF